MNTIVDFSIAKLLKDKKFNDEVLHFYCKNRTCNYTKKPYKYSFEVDANQERLVNGEIDNFGYGLTWSAPTIAEVVMWLYEKHEIWIEVNVDINGRFRYILRKHNSTDNAWEVKNPTSISEYTSLPTEVYSKAIKYILNNLI